MYFRHVLAYLESISTLKKKFFFTCVNFSKSKYRSNTGQIPVKHRSYRSDLKISSKSNYTILMYFRHDLGLIESIFTQKRKKKKLPRKSQHRSKGGQKAVKHRSKGGQKAVKPP